MGFNSGFKGLKQWLPQLVQTHTYKAFTLELIHKAYNIFPIIRFVGLPYLVFVTRPLIHIS